MACLATIIMVAVVLLSTNGGLEVVANFRNESTRIESNVLAIKSKDSMNPKSICYY